MQREVTRRSGVGGGGGLSGVLGADELRHEDAELRVKLTGAREGRGQGLS